MTRIPTNFGSYEIDEREAMPPVQRWLRQLREVLLTALAVVLAGLFVFPAKALDVTSARDGRAQNPPSFVCPQESAR